MTKPIEEKLKKIPLINFLVRLLKRLRLPGLEGLSFYDLLELYVNGIARGALTTRASAIAFSFFMALFPFILFLLNFVTTKKMNLLYRMIVSLADGPVKTTF